MTHEGQASAPHVENDLWLDKAAAAALLKVRHRQLEKRAEQGLIAKKTLPRRANEKTARVVYSRSDIEGILAGDKAPPRNPVAALAARPEVSDAMVVAAFKAAMFQRPEPAPKPWLTAQEAADWSGLPKRWLIRGALLGRVNAVNVAGDKHPKWMFSRSGLERAI